ncbi:MAG TPA: DUF1640 domain-containing protein [Bdellovibrionota bacterium]|jgi:hypothetical protein
MFNALNYTKKLESAGIPREHAEAHAQMMAEVIEDNLATKQDLKELEYRLIIKLGTIMGVLFTLTVAILGFLIRLK